jgi:hypothetical protein
MGLDFIRRGRRSFEKAWSNGAVELSNPDLFNSPPGKPSRFLLASIFSASLHEGEQLIAMVDGERILLTRDLAKVGCIEQAPSELIAHLREMGGFGYAVAERLNPLSESAEIRVWLGEDDA